MAETKKEKKEKKKKDGTSVVLPKAWQSAVHRNESAQARANISGLWKAVGLLVAVLLVAFVLFGGISIKGFLKAVGNWSHNVGVKVSNWIAGVHVVNDEDGVHIDPLGQDGEQLAPTLNPEDVHNPANTVENIANPTSSVDVPDDDTPLESDDVDVGN